MLNVTSGKRAPKKFYRFTGYNSYAVSKFMIIVRLCTVERIKLINPSRNGLNMYVTASDATDNYVTTCGLKTNEFKAS